MEPAIGQATNIRIFWIFRSPATGCLENSEIFRTEKERLNLGFCYGSITFMSSHVFFL